MIYIVSKVTKDNRTRRAYAPSKMTLRPCKELSHSGFLKYLKHEAFGNVSFEAALLCQKEGETDDEFMMRVAMNGYGPDFIDHIRLENEFDEFIDETIDCETGKAYA